MGSPLSPLIAEIFMNTLENRIFHHDNAQYNRDIIYWYRYVDDVLCMWNGGVDKLNKFPAYLNSLYPSIRFTLEIGGTSINFLDMNMDTVSYTHLTLPTIYSV